MGIIISAIGEGKFPRPVRVQLYCDRPAGLLCVGFEIFEHADGFAGAHGAAMAKGWLERQAPQGRLWLCPACSGKI